MSRSLPADSTNKEVNNFISTISYLKNAGDAHVSKQNYSIAIQYYNNALSYLDKLTKDYLQEVRSASNHFYSRPFNTGGNIVGAPQKAP